MKNGNDIHDIDIDKLRLKHSDFMERYRLSSNKLDADRHLIKTKVYSRIKYVLELMVEIGVIDQIRPEEAINGDSEAKIYKLIKNGYYSTVSLATNGTMIILYADERDKIFEGSLCEPSKIHNAELEDFHWGNFALHVLEYIQHVIYHSKEAYLLAIFKEA